MTSPKSYYIENLGCAKNQVDAEVIISALDSEGWIRTPDPSSAELIIVNTCGFIEPAREESIDVLISLRDAFPDALVVAAGCLSQRYPEELASSMPELDGIFGNNSVSMITDFVKRLSEGKNQYISVPDLSEITEKDFSRDDRLSVYRKTLLSGASTAYVKLSEGCSNNCSFCAIPLIRGPVRSRPVRSIVEEIQNLSAAGIGEINLIAQDLGSYGTDLVTGNSRGDCLLPLLLDEIEKIPGDFIVRMLYIHPDNFPFEILDICAKSSRIVPYFDIPFQHASGRILSAMNRRGNSAEYLELLKRIRTNIPDAVVRTTFLLGFPGERREDVSELEQFIESAELEWAGFFVYSPEEGTTAYAMERPGKLKKRAKSAQKDLERLQQLQTGITSRVLGRFDGRRLRLIVEEGIEKENLYLCRAWFQAPEVDSLVVLHAEEGRLSPGDFIEAVITGVNGIDLEAVLK